MEQKIEELLSRTLPDIDLNDYTELVDDGILDSLAMTQVIYALTEEFGITIPYEELSEENFNSVSAIAAMVERLQSEMFPE